MEDPTSLLLAALANMEETSTEEAQDGTVADLARRLDLIQRIVSHADRLADALSEALAPRMESDEIIVDSIGRLVRRSRTSSTWIDDTSRERLQEDALRAITRRVATDPSTGEIHPSVASAVQETWRLVTDAFSLGADPKAAFRKALGLSPDDYRSRRFAGYTVQIRDASAEGER